jgi:hypothetical protein
MKGGKLQFLFINVDNLLIFSIFVFMTNGLFGLIYKYLVTQI